jgi:hypothetical protein
VLATCNIAAFLYLSHDEFNMKRITVITFAIFVTVVILVFATNFIHWDETPLEQSIAALPLGLGLLLELPFLLLGAMLTGNGSDNGLISYGWYSTMMQVMPFLAGAFYSGLFYIIATHVTKQKPRKI